VQLGRDKYRTGKIMASNNSGITPLNPAQVALQEQQAATENYPRRVLIGLDMFANTLTNGHPSETISSRAARAATEGKWWGRTLSKALDKLQPDHGAKAECGDVERAVIVEHLEESSGTLETTTVTKTTTVVTKS
jgi:hypothetical protein